MIRAKGSRWLGALLLTTALVIGGVWNHRSRLPIVLSEGELETIVPSLMPLLDLIASGEGEYTSVNRGRAGDTKISWTKQTLGKEITQMTMIELRKHQGGRQKECWFRGKRGAANLYAVGRYQVVPCTLKGAMLKIIGFNGKDVYDKATQDMLGAYLVLMKRQRLGKYLLGYSDDQVGAGQELAKEFASVPIPVATGRCEVGQSYYCGDSAGNAAQMSLPEVNRVLQGTREQLWEDQNVRALLKGKWWL